jgi:hypothetical protein
MVAVEADRPVAACLPAACAPFAPELHAHGLHFTGQSNSNRQQRDSKQTFNNMENAQLY